jgi:hypothetical protein
MGARDSRGSGIRSPISARAVENWMKKKIEKAANKSTRFDPPFKSRYIRFYWFFIFANFLCLAKVFM